MHLPAVTITLTLLSLYIAKIRWDKPSSESLNALQFAAKVQEAAILMSLGDILLYRISCGLSRQDVGVPLGFLSSAFYLSAPLRCLVSRQLWVPTFRPGNNAKYQRVTGVMVVLVSILCMGASLLSAIAMIPRLDWWKDDLFNPFDKEDTVDYRPVLRRIPAVKYRTRFDGKSGPFIKNITGASFDPQDMLLSAGIAEEGPKTEFANCTYSNYGIDDTLISIKYEPLMISGTRPLSFVTLGLSNASMNDFGGSSAIPWLTASYQQAPDSGSGIAWKQPLVTIQCNFSSLVEENADEFYFTSLNETIRLNANNLTARAELRDRKSAGYQLLNLRTRKELPICADILFRTTEEWGTEYTLCLIFASWSEADTWIESPMSYNSLFKLKEPISNITEGTPRDLIHMDDKWMEGISSLSNKSFFTAIANWCEGTDTILCFELMLTLHITDALAQAGNNNSWPEYFSNAETSDEARDGILYTRYYYTYAYRFGSSRGIPLAFSFLLLHVLMVLTHLIEVMRSKEPWDGSDWDNFGDMFVLALASKPPDGANELTRKFDKSELWQKTVMFSTDGEEGQSRLVISEEKGYQRTSQQEGHV